MDKFIILSVIAFLSVNTVFANDIDPFIGKWSVNVEKTFEEIQSSTKFNPENAETDKKILSSLAGLMRIELSNSSITYIRGKKSRVIPYKINSSTPSSFTAEVVINEKSFTLSFRLLDGEFLNMKSTGSDDMDFYIWQKFIKGQGVDSELKVITNIVSDVISDQ